MDICQEIENRIAAAIPGAEIQVSGASGHFEIWVSSHEFEGKRIIAKHRMVLGAIKDLMAGNDAPLHAVDKLTCVVP